jgi:carbon storage regulator CsrA
MLILRRKHRERIVLDGGIIIEVLEIVNGYEVQLGIDAPKDVKIMREELLPWHDRPRRTLPLDRDLPSDY